MAHKDESFPVDKKRRKGRGTGTLRRNRWDAILEAEGWDTCTHGCPVCWKFWEHRIPSDMTCYQDIFAVCGDCLAIQFEGEFARMKIRLK